MGYGLSTVATTRISSPEDTRWKELKRDRDRDDVGYRYVQLLPNRMLPFRKQR